MMLSSQDLYNDNISDVIGLRDAKDNFKVPFRVKNTTVIREFSDSGYSYEEESYDIVDADEKVVQSSESYAIAHQIYNILRIRFVIF